MYERFTVQMTTGASDLSFRQHLVHPHELGDAGGLRGGLDVEAVGPHDGLVVLLVGPPQLRRHGHLVVEVGQAGLRVQGPGVQDGLGGLLNFGLLLLRRRGLGEVIVDNILRVAITHF